MNDDSLRERLAKLHAELQLAHRADPETHRPLGEVLPDIKRLAEQPGADPRDAALRTRLEQVAVHFEAQHPKLAGTVRSIVELLSEVGI